MICQFLYCAMHRFVRRCSSFASLDKTSIESSFQVSPSKNHLQGKNVKKQLYAWGLAEHGALGLEKYNNKHHTRVPRFKHKPNRLYFGETHQVTHIDCGFGFTAFAVKTKTDLNKLFGCGINSDSQIGNQEVRPNHPLGILLSPSPIHLGLNNLKTNIISLSAGRAHLAVVTDNEGTFTLGSNCYGQCGRTIIENEKYSGSNYVHNIKCLEDSKIVSVVCGQDHTLFLTEDGKVFACGWGADGQTGCPSGENISAPCRVLGDISNQVIVKLVGKCDTVMALSNNGDVFGWGNTEYSQFNSDIDGRTFINSPLYLNKLKFAGRIVDIAAGGSFCMALNDEGTVFVWGYGILGAGPRVDKSTNPIALPKALFGCNEFQPDSKVVSISCGLNHKAAITNYGNLYTWGRNQNGCLGIGHIRDQYFPYKVSIGAQVELVSCGVDHTMALCCPFV